jgi:hypothetical protein
MEFVWLGKTSAMSANANGEPASDVEEETRSRGSSDHWHLIAAAATTALAPYVEEATEAAAEWITDRWPDYAEKTLLPAIAEAVGADGGGARNDSRSADGDAASTGQKVDPLRAGALAGAAAAVLGAAGILLARR